MKHLMLFGRLFRCGASGATDKLKRFVGFFVWRHFLFNINPFFTALFFLSCSVANASQAATTAPAKEKVAIQYVLSQDLLKVSKVNGELVEKFIPNAKEILHKDILREEIQITNVSSKTQTNVQIQIPIPQGTEFIGKATSASSRWKLSYSTDKGKTFSVTPLQDIPVKENDKVIIKTTPAPLSTYTNVKWTVTSLNPKETLKFSFRVQVK